MRLGAVGLLLLAASPAWAGEALVVDKAPSPSPDAEAGRPASTPDAVPALVPEEPKPAAPAVSYAAIYDAPVFGKANGSAEAKVDESALRYYAAQKNHTRVDAEIRRLKLLYPTWKVPANLYAPAGLGNDEQPLWDLFGAGKLDELHAAIKQREQRELGWRPSADLATKIARREASAALVALSDAKEWGRVLEAANRMPTILSCASVDIDWRVAEAFARTGERKRAFEIDAAILATCTNRDERLATVRKAIALLSTSDVNALIGMGKTLPDGSGEFDPVRLDLVRARIGEALAGGKDVDVGADGLKLLGDATLKSGNGTDAALLGWYAAHTKAWAEAETWFKLGMEGTRGDPKLAEGRALALRNLGRMDEAEQLATVWRDRSPALRAMYFGFVVERLTRVPVAPVDPAVVSDFTGLVTTDKNPDGAQALAWYGYNRKDWAGAAQWFKSALDWAADKTPRDDADPKIIVGYALALQNLGRPEEAEDLAYAHREQSPDIRSLYVSLAVTELTRPDPAPPIPSDRYAQFADVIFAEQSAAGATALGWRHLREHDDRAAVDWFKASIGWSPDGKGDLKANEGYALALKGAGRYAEAEEVAYAWLARSPDMRTAFRSIVTAELTDAALAERMTEPRLARFVAVVEADKSSEGAQALGWYRLQDGGCGYAVNWFRKAIAWSSDGKGDAKTNEGYAQALHVTGRDAEAEDVAFDWIGRSADMKAIYIKDAVESLTRAFPPVRITEARLARFSEVVLAEHSANGAQALGWHRYREAGCGYGVQWFALSTAWSPDRRGDAKTNEGYASALRDVGKLAESEAVLYPWVDRVALMRDIFIDVVVAELTRDDPPAPLPEDRLANFVAVATPLRSALAAQALGWYRFARHEYPDSVRWFKLAVEWWPALPPDVERKPDSPEGYRPLDARLALRMEDYRRTPRAFSSLAEDRDKQSQSYLQTFGGWARTWTGYAMALRAVGRSSDAEEVAYAWRDRWTPLKRLFVDIAVTELTRPNAPEIAADRMKRFTSAIEGDRSVPGAQALGWYNTGRKNWTEAAVWFKAAMDWQLPEAPVEPKVVEGYASALRSAGRYDEALAVAAEWRDRIPELRAFYVDTTLDWLLQSKEILAPDRLTEIVDLATATKTPRAAMALGWYFYNGKQAAKALPWFKAAITEAPQDQVDPKALEGFALTLRALGRSEDALTFSYAWREKIPSLRDVAADTAVDLLTRNNGRDPISPASLAHLTEIVQNSKSANDAAAFGWYQFAQKNWTSAVDWFRTAQAWSADGRGDAKYAEGYASALRNQCRFRDAEEVAAPWINDPAGGAVRQVFVDTVAERLARQKAAVPMSDAESQRFASAVLAANSANGAQALGWYSYNSRQYRPAAAWFEKSLSWNVTEGTVYGLVMAHRRMNDTEGVLRTLALYGNRYPRLMALRRPGAELSMEAVRGLNDNRECGSLNPGKQNAADASSALLFAGARAEALASPAIMAAAAALPIAETQTQEVRAQAYPLQSPAGDPPTDTRPDFDAPPLRVRPLLRPRVARVARAEVAPAASGSGRNTAGAAAALSAKDYSRCLAILDERERSGRLSANEHQTRGWCLLDLERPVEASLAFQAARDREGPNSKGDSAFGQSLSFLRSGDANAAAAVADAAPLTSERRTLVGLQVMSQQAYQAFQGGRWAETLAILDRRAAFSAENRDLMILRGWALFHLGDYDSARRFFTAADRQTSDVETQRALAAVGGSIAPKER